MNTKTHPTDSGFRVFLSLVPVLRKEWSSMLWTFLISALSVASLAALAVVISWAVGSAVVDRVAPAAATWWLLGSLVLLRAMLTWHEMDVSHSLAYRVLASLRMALFSSYLRSVPAKRREHSGHAAATAMGDIEKLEFFYAHTVAQLGAAFSVWLAGAVLLSFLSPALSVTIVLAGLILLMSSWLASGPARSVADRQQELAAELSARVVDLLGGSREVAGYGLLPKLRTGLFDQGGALGAAQRRSRMIAQTVAAARDLLVTATVVIVALIAVGNSAIPVALIPALIALALAICAPLADAANTISQLHPLLASAQRVSEASNRAAATVEAEQPIDLPEGKLGLELSEVQFSYNSERQVLSNLNLKVFPGEHVGIAGVSGAGKSTLVLLAARLWDPDGGEVFLIDEGGRRFPLRRISDGRFRSAVQLVEQDATLFHGSVAENLRLGAPDINDDDLQAVLDQVGAASWIGLDDQLGEGGSRLSGGQHARLCLARALVRAPQIVILDETTANLDPVVEAEVSALVASLDCTVLAISHRPETLATMDRVFSLGGQAVEVSK